MYPKIYDFLKIFNVRAIGVESAKNQTKISIFKRSDPSKPLTTYANELNNTDELIDFINVETLPLLTKLNDENYIRIFGSFIDVIYSLYFRLSFYSFMTPRTKAANKLKQ